MSQILKKRLCWMVYVALMAAGILVPVLWLVTSFDYEEFPIHHGDLILSTIMLDARDVFRGDVYPFEFRFKNSSRRDVEIVRTLTSCTCTDANVSPKLIIPGQVGCLTGKIHFTNKAGRVKERVLVETSNGNRYVFTISANVLDRYVVKPLMLDFGDVWWDDTLKGAVFIDSQNIQNPLESLEIVPGHNDSVKARITKCNQGKWWVDIAVQNLKSGSFHQRVLVKTNNPRQPEIFIPIRANVLEPVTVEPKTLFVGTVSLEQIVPCQLIVTKRSGMKTEIANISTSKIPIVRKEVLPFSENMTKIELELRFSEDEGLVEDNLAIETSSPKWVAYIPIVAFVSK